MRKSRAIKQPTAESTLKTSTVCYIRVSSKEQQEEGFSLDAQIKLLMDYAQRKGIEVIRTFMDVETAKSPGRKEFNNLVSFLRSEGKLAPGKNPCRSVLVEKTDRFYRNVQDFAVMNELGVNVHLVKENVVMTSQSRSHEKFVHGLNVLLAERTVNNLSEETQKGMLEKARQGIWPSFAPIGFRNIDGPNGKRIIEPDPVQAPLVRQMFEMYAKGIYSLRDICREAYKAGLVHRKSGNKIGRSTIHDILTNPLYYGDFYWKGVLYNGTHQTVISKELFDKVQAAMNKKSNCPTGRQKHDFLFQRMLTCGYCGCAMVAEIQKGRYIYYHCTGNRGKCPGKYAREEQIDQQFSESLKQVRIDDDVMDWIVTVMKKSTSEDKKQRETQLAALTKQKKRLEDRLEKMYLDKLDETISEDEYKRLSNKFRTELTDLKFRMEQLKAGNENHIDSSARLLELAQKAASLYSAQIPVEKRKLLNCVYSNSTWASGELTPKFREPFDILAVTNQAYQREKSTRNGKNDHFEIWGASEDSNYSVLTQLSQLE